MQVVQGVLWFQVEVRYTWNLEQYKIHNYTLDLYVLVFTWSVILTEHYITLSCKKFFKFIYFASFISWCFILYGSGDPLVGFYNLFL